MPVPGDSSTEGGGEHSGDPMLPPGDLKSGENLAPLGPGVLECDLSSDPDES